MNSRNYTFDEVVIAAMLHDIGKFAQRTGRKELSDESMEGQLCPTNNKGHYHTHKHVLYTFRSIEKMKDVFPDGCNFGNIQTLAAAHHRPSGPIEHIITQADWISSGADRTTLELDTEEKKKYYETPLRSIFSSVGFGDREKQEDRKIVYYNINELSPNAIFPAEHESVGMESYCALWEKFENDSSHLTGKTVEEFLGALDSMLEHYTWCIPSSTIDQPDISLYDHLKTTAAFSAALYRYHEAEGSLLSEAAVMNRNTKKFFLLSGDISGIQKYIFNIKIQKGSAKTLRARSFEIQYLEQTAARAILQGCGMPLYCSLWNAGGRFLLVLPNTTAVRGKVDELRLQIERYFLTRFFGTLSLNISAGIEASADDLSQNKARELFSAVNLDVAEAKQAKLKEAITMEGHIFEKEYTKITAGDVCPACGIRASEPGNLDLWCNDCTRLRKIGGILPKAKFMAFPDTSIVLTANSFDFDEVFLETNVEKIPDGLQPFSINIYTPGYALYRMPYHVPMNEKTGDVLEFDDIARKAEGDKKIAMLKADLDNLGAVFGFGLGKYLSISRFATMSRMLNYFFTSWVHHSLNGLDGETDFRFLYIVFSGGDDLCLLGPWNTVIEYAHAVQEAFARFTGYNPDLHISAGIALSGPSLPMGHLSERAEKLLKDAKALPTKNAVSLFDSVMPWNLSREMVAAGKRIVSMMNKGGGKGSLGHGIVYRLIDYQRRYRNFKKGKILDRNALWKSNFVYDTARNLKELSNEDREWFVSLADEKNIDSITVPASYALYSNRERKGE